MQSDRERPHRRLNLLTGEWVLVSPQRGQRPWSGESMPASLPPQQSYDPLCPLCPGNQRQAQQKNPDYRGVYSFENDFPALEDVPPSGAQTDSCSLLQWLPATGQCWVTCFSEDHSRTLASMSHDAITGLFQHWQQLSRKLGEKFQWVQVFENKGAMMGCSIPHPHCQTWAVDHIPFEIEREMSRQQAYFAEKGRSLLLDYGCYEVEAKQRLVASNGDWVAVVPWWATWPFELLIIPRFPVAYLHEVGQTQTPTLVRLMSEVFQGLDRLFQCPFPYSFGWHGAPFDGSKHPSVLLHGHIYPPLLRSAAVKKHMVGYELLAEKQRDITPEQAAERIRLALCSGVNDKS